MLKRIAIVGASSDPAKFGHIILKDLQGKGFELFPVNPRQTEILGRRVAPRVSDLPADIDLLVFVLPPAAGLAVAREALAAGFRRFWFQPGAGSPEIGQFLECQPGVLLVMDRCIMVETAAGRPLPL